MRRASVANLGLTRGETTSKTVIMSAVVYYAPAPVGKGAISVALICPSVCLPVRPSRTLRIIREPKGLAYPNLEGRFAILDATRVPVSRSKGQRSGSPGPLMLTHIVRHIFLIARLRSSNLIYGWRTTTRINRACHGLQGQRSTSQAHIVCTSHLCLFLIRETKCCTCTISGGQGHTASAKPDGHTSGYLCLDNVFL